MAFLLNIETTTKNCSIALFENENLITLKEQRSEKYSHAEQLILFIEEVLRQANISLKEIHAIALSKGPGSYTGLRIGTSTAKGLCYSLGIPLISISTLRAMAFEMAKKEDYTFYCPMIDARRMEVFSSIYDQANKEVRQIQADIVDENTYAKFFVDKILFFGDGALKCKTIISSANATFIEGVLPSAQDMGELAFRKFINNEFESTAYFEPYYLKDFVTGKKANN
tara:strand:+ start:1625 stop:2302 length:678 start_codon:yes stop_codon:yes gene_type:complete